MATRTLTLSRRRVQQLIVLLSVIAFAAVGARMTTSASAAPLTLCGNPGPAPAPIQHVIVVMLENQSFSTVMNPANAPYEAGPLASQCGVATHMYGATHNSAANYLAVAAGQYDPARAKGCGTVAACSSTADNLFAQSDAAGLGWKNYVEAAGPTPANCLDTVSIPNVTKIGHEPGLFFNRPDCPADVVPVPDLTAASGALWDDLQAGSLPAISWVTPSEVDDGEGPNHLAGADAWLHGFLDRLQTSASYQAGTTAVLVTYDEGGQLPDQTLGEDCTNQTKDLAGQQESCHVPFFVVSPYTPAASVDTFYDHYSITRTVEDLFGWPHLAHADDPQTANLLDGFGLQGGAFATTTTTTTTSSTTTTTTATTPPPPTTTEYVKNAGVESDLTGWQGRYNATSTIARVQPGAGAHDGGWSLQITNSATATKAAGVTNKQPMWVDGTTTPTLAGRTYTGTVWVQAAAGTKVSLRLSECNSKGAACTNLRTTAVKLASTAWTPLTVTITPTASGKSIGFILFATLPKKASLLADSFSLTAPTG